MNRARAVWAAGARSVIVGARSTVDSRRLRITGVADAENRASRPVLTCAWRSVDGSSRNACASSWSRRTTASAVRLACTASECTDSVRSPSAWNTRPLLSTIRATASLWAARMRISRPPS